jgi:hypothetical protein
LGLSLKAVNQDTAEITEAREKLSEEELSEAVEEAITEEIK